jgi:hypothetical protein
VIADFCRRVPCLGDALGPENSSTFSYKVLVPHHYLPPPTTASLRLSLMTAQTLGQVHESQTGSRAKFKVGSNWDPAGRQGF